MARGDLRSGLMLWGENRSVAPGLVRKMLNGLADSLATVDTVLVWDVDGQPLSCVCRSLIERDGEPLYVSVPFIYTVAKARRHGLALALLKYIKAEADTLGVDMKATTQTPNGVALKRALDA